MNKQKEVNKKKKKKFKYPWVIIALNVIIITVCGYFVVKEVMLTIQLNNDIEESKEVIAELEKEYAILEDQRDNLNDEDYILRYARGKYNVNLDGEQVFKLPS